MSIHLILVLVAFTQHCTQCTVLCIQGLLPLKEERLLYCTAFCLVGLAVHKSEEAILLTFWDLSTTRVIASKTQANPQFFKIKGPHPCNSYRSIGTKLHPPHPNRDCLATYCTNLDPKSALQCLTKSSL